MKKILSAFALLGLSLSTTVAAPEPAVVTTPAEVKQHSTDVQTWRKNLVDSKKKLDAARLDLKAKEEEVKKTTNDFKKATVHLINAYEKEYEKNKKQNQAEPAGVALKINETDIIVD